MTAQARSEEVLNGRQPPPYTADGARGRPREIVAVERMVVPDKCLVMAHDPLDPRCEKVRALRTELLLRRNSQERGDLVTLMSPCPGEGRSQLAAELAIGFAQLGRPTLLVDADLRQPKQHLLFNADNRWGLSEAITSGEEPELQLVKGLPEMYLLPSGMVPSNPLELLLSNHFAEVVQDWREQFDFVVIDTSPVSQYSDALAVASLGVRVLALSRAQHTPYKESQDMLRRLGTTHSQVVGAVINHF